MTVQSEYAIAIATLSDWLKNVVPFLQLMRSNRTLYARLFPRFEQVTGNSLEFCLMHRPVITSIVIGRKKMSFENRSYVNHMVSID